MKVKAWRGTGGKSVQYLESRNFQYLYLILQGQSGYQGRMGIFTMAIDMSQIVQIHLVLQSQKPKFGRLGGGKSLPPTGCLPQLLPELSLPSLSHPESLDPHWSLTLTLTDLRTSALVDHTGFMSGSFWSLSLSMEKHHTVPGRDSQSSFLFHSMLAARTRWIWPLSEPWLGYLIFKGTCALPEHKLVIFSVKHLKTVMRFVLGDYQLMAGLQTPKCSHWLRGYLPIQGLWIHLTEGREEPVKSPRALISPAYTQKWRSKTSINI